MPILPRLLRFGIPLTLVTSLAIACGSEDGSTFPGGSSNGASGTSGASGGTSGIGASGGTSGASGGTSGASGGPTCSGKLSRADRQPAHLFFILDQSLSMRGGRWTRVTTSFKSFLNDPLSEGVSASLEMFPTKTDEPTACNKASYATLDVDFKALPGSGPFDALLNADPNTPVTPTLAVLEGIAPQAQAHARANTGVRTAIVLMTDGIPQQCNGNTVNAAGAEVAKVKADAPTYVIGVGPNLEDLNEIAEKGGTTRAFLINDQASPETAAQKFREAIDTIRGAVLSCDLTIPAAPAGETLDPKKANVNYTTGAGAKTALVYDQACKGAGWKFDNEAAPTKISLCKTSCDTYKADPKGLVDVEFGCDRRETEVK